MVKLTDRKLGQSGVTRPSFGCAPIDDRISDAETAGMLEAALNAPQGFQCRVASHLTTLA